MFPVLPAFAVFLGKQRGKSQKIWKQSLIITALKANFASFSTHRVGLFFLCRGGLHYSTRVDEGRNLTAEVFVLAIKVEGTRTVARKGEKGEESAV